MSTYTSSQLEVIKPTDKIQELTIEKMRHGQGCLLMRTMPDGIKNFYYRYYIGKARRFALIGTFDRKGQRSWREIRGDRLTLAAAKEGAKWIADLVAQFGDVDHYEAHERQKKEEDRRQATIIARQGSFGQLLDVYVEHLERLGKSSSKNVNNVIELHVRTPFSGLLKAKANQIEPADIQLILARLVQLGKTRQVNKLRSYLHAAFAYGGKHDNDPRKIASDSVTFSLTSNPASLVPRIAEFERVGDRVLTESELGLFWNALSGLTPVPAAFLRFNLALGGQRMEQLLRANWSDFDFDRGILTLRDGKGRPGLGVRDHLVPLTDWSLQHLEPMRELNQDAPYPFATITKIGRGKILMDPTTPSKVVKRVSNRLALEHGLEPFRAGDLRRTCETMLASLAIPKECRGQLLSHGRSSGVQAKHYDRCAYLPEKKQALEIWTNHLAKILFTPTS
jgi:integrase